MITALIILLLGIFALILWFFLFPVMYVRKAGKPSGVIEPPNGYLYSYVIHIHTQFSYDSLGKPSDLLEAKETQGIDYVIVTDHDNDNVRFFADDWLLAGREVKVHNAKGQLVGDLLEIGELKVIAHPFREKYRWRLEKREDYLIELIDLRDALFEKRASVLLFVLGAMLLYPLLGGKVLSHLTRLIDTLRYVRRYFREGWRNKPVGGLDHHVKLYLQEVRKKVLFPPYSVSFSLLRNFLLTDRKVKDGREFLKALREGINLISFSPKPSFVWKEGKRLKACSPFEKTLMVIVSEKGEERAYLGPNLEYVSPEKCCCIVLGYSYAFRIGGLLFGIRPLFISDLMEVGGGR